MVMYKSCCNFQCLSLSCIVREKGGCYCACRLVEYINALKVIISGTRAPKGCVSPEIEVQLNKISLEEEKYFQTKKVFKILEKCEKMLQEKYIEDPVDIFNDPVLQEKYVIKDDW